MEKNQFNEDKERSLSLKSISLSKKYHIHNLQYVHSSRHQEFDQTSRFSPHCLPKILHTCGLYLFQCLSQEKCFCCTRFVTKSFINDYKISSVVFCSSYLSPVSYQWRSSLKSNISSEMRAETGSK